MRKAMIAGIAIMGMASVRAAEAPGTELAVEADGFADAKGLAVLNVYDSVGKMAGEPPRFSFTAPIEGGSARFRLRDFPCGAWAFLVFQDRNGNNEIDHGWNRFPTEPLGYSRGFVPGLSSGMPSFGKAGVPVTGPSDTVHVTVAPVDFKSFFRRESR